MGYTDFSSGPNTRKGSTGALGSLKGKPHDKMKTTGKEAITGLGSGTASKGNKSKGGKK